MEAPGCAGFDTAPGNVLTLAGPSAATSELAYSHATAFGYTADAPRGPVYPDGTVTTGDAVFLQVVDDIEVTFDWHLEPPPGHEADVSGSGQLLVEVSDGSGWRRTVELGEPRDIDGPEASLRAPLDVTRIQRLVTSVQGATGATGTSQTLTVMADLRIEGTIAGEPVTDELRPAAAFTLDELRLQPPSAEGEDGGLVSSTPGTVDVGGGGAGTVDVLGRPLAVPVVRAAAVGFGVIALLLAAAWVALRRRERARTPEEHIRARYDVIATAGMAPADGRTRVEVSTIEDLVRLGERLSQPVLEVPLTDGGTAYIVDDGYSLYRYRPDPG